MSFPSPEIERVFREESGPVLATLIRVLGDFDLAEDARQDAFLAALQRWKTEGVPDNPGAWIQRVARNKAIDRLRRRRFEQPSQPLADMATHEREIDALLAQLDEPIEDDQLRLIFTCCHPSLESDARVALTLSTVGGLRTEEIARAFLVPRATLAQRLVRAKKKIKLAGIPFRVPPHDLLPERLPTVLLVLYLIFNEGYSATSGDVVVRRELCEEAIRLGKLLITLMPDEPESHGLLALMLFQHARGDTRMQDDGSIVLLEKQDRSRWDRDLIAEGSLALERARRSRAPGSYTLQAEIAGQHSLAPTSADTDWSEIERLYRSLLALHSTPVVALNHAVAVLMAEGPERALPLLDSLAQPLSGYVYFHSTRGEVLRRLARETEARKAFQQALNLTLNESERAFLAAKLEE